MTFPRIAALGIGFMVSTAQAQWPQWGGPKRDFSCDAGGVPEKWPEGGPKTLWSRPLGAGYSAVVVDGGTLYTMYRDDAADSEVVTAVEAESGKTVWESKYSVEVPPEHVSEFGKGPRATPLIAGDKLVTVSLTGRLACWDRKTGKELWSQELISRMNGSPLMHGYCTSPMLYKDKVITFVGGGGQAVMAFNVADGDIAWGVGDFTNTYSSPILINVGGQDQIVAFMANEVTGVAADGSAVLWEHPHRNQWSTNIPTPVWGEGNLLYISSEGTSGSRCLKLTRSGDKTRVEEVWANRTFKQNHTNAVRIGDYLYGSSGGAGPSFLSCVSMKDGEVKWKERGFKAAKMLHAGDRFLLLDEGGTLGLVRMTPDKLEVLGKSEVLDGTAWTAPTVAAGKVFLRDNKNLMAVSLP
jgi:outer membrane protein assembly factor BamB